MNWVKVKYYRKDWETFMFSSKLPVTPKKGDVMFVKVKNSQSIPHNVEVKIEKIIFCFNKKGNFSHFKCFTDYESKI